MKKKVIMARHSHRNVEMIVEGKDQYEIHEKAHEQVNNIDFQADGIEELGSVEYEILDMSDVP